MKRKKTNLNVIIFLICLAGIFVSMLVVFGLVENFIDKSGNTSSSEDEFSYSDYEGKQVYYNGAYYIPKESVESILILGIDASEERADSLQSDFIALVILDKKQESFHILQLNRDTMTDITQIDKYGEVYGTYYAQLALAHTYGGDGRAQCRNTVSVVENLLYGIEIDHYLSMTMDAVPILNDSVDGVTVQLLDDFTYLDETFVKDAVVTLRGEQALAYVQARGGLEDSTNLHRMERQRQYVSALFEKYSSMNSENTLETMMKVNEHLVSDCTIDQLSRLLERLGGYAYDGIVSLEGEAVEGEYMEYYIDEPAAQKTVIELFYEPLEK